VRVLQATEVENPRRPAPEERVRGMSGIVETTGKACGSGEGTEKYLSLAYFVRVEGIGPVLVGEDWLEAEPAEDLRLLPSTLHALKFFFKSQASRLVFRIRCSPRPLPDNTI